METNELTKDFKADALVKLYGERVRETGWSNSLTGVMGHYKKGIEDGYRLGLQSCEEQLKDLKKVNNETAELYAESLGKELELQEQLKAKDEEIANLKTVMIAAAEEIQAHWQAHCDAEGYGPANLMRRLEKGIPSQYGYKAGAFMRQKELVDGQLVRIDSLTKENERLREALKDTLYLVPIELANRIDSLLTETKPE